MAKKKALVDSAKERLYARDHEEPELSQSAEEGVFHAPEEVDGEYFCRWDEEEWPCSWVVDTEAKRVAALEAANEE